MQVGLMPTTARFYAAEICCVLEYLRQEGVVHRDLKVGAAVGDVYHNHALSKQATTTTSVFLFKTGNGSRV